MEGAIGSAHQGASTEWWHSSSPLTVEDYIRIARRRTPYALAGFVVLALVALYIVVLLPSVYRATGTIAVESQQIPDDLVRSTVRGSADQRIGFVEQIVMTDARLEKIISDFDLYPELVATKPITRVIEKLRRNISVEAIRDPLSLQGTIGFQVSFDHTEPAAALAVTNTLVEMFLGENARSRQARATETAEFLRRATAELDSKVRGLEQQIARFKQANSDALPEHLNMRVNMLQQAEFGLRAVEREIAATEQEQRSLQVQRSALLNRPAPVVDANSPGLTPAQRLELLNAELSKVRATYTEAHPDVIRLKRMVADAQAEIAASGGAQAGGPRMSLRDNEDAAVVQFDTQLAALNVRLSSLRDERKELSDRIVDLRAQIMKTAQVEQGLRELNFNYEHLAEEYDGVRAKQREAELAESLEAEHKAERFTLLDPPRLPVEPKRPKRLKLGAAALVAALGGGLAAALGVEVVDTRIRDSRTLARLIGGRPFAVLPYVQRKDERYPRMIRAVTILVGFLVFLGLAGLVGYYYSPAVASLLRVLYY